MKIPMLGLHILTDKTLQQKLDKAKTETRQITNRQMASLLYKNAEMTLTLRNLAGGKKRRKE